MELLTGNKILAKSNKAKSMLVDKGIGEKTEGCVVLDLKEALHLLEKAKIEIEDSKGEAMDYDALLQYASKREQGFYSKYLVYKDFREKGYCIKTGFKFGFDYRVYPKGKKMGEAHSEYVVNVMTQDERLSMPEVSRLARMSQTLNTKVLLAVVDSEGDINYYEVTRTLP